MAMEIKKWAPKVTEEEKIAVENFFSELEELCDLYHIKLSVFPACGCCGAEATIVNKDGKYLVEEFYL